MILSGLRQDSELIRRKARSRREIGHNFSYFRHVCMARIVQALQWWCHLIWSGLEDELNQQSHDLVCTKRNNTEHQVCIDLLVSTYPQMARSKFVLETTIYPFNHSSLSIALICRMDKIGIGSRLVFSFQRFLQVLVASWVRVNNANTAIFFE